jgi:ferrous-iron efflux pump FieF
VEAHAGAGRTLSARHPAIEPTPSRAVADGAAPGALMRRATYWSVAVAMVLIVLKLGAVVMTDSVALLSTLIDSLLDAAASLVNLFAVRPALTPADREHRFGHGKAEALAGLAQAAFIAGSAMFLLFEAGHRLVVPKMVEHPDLGVAVMVVSTIFTIALVYYQRYVIRRTSSLAISADSLHYVGDVLVNVGVVVSLAIGSYWGWLYTDPLFAIAITGYVMHSAWVIGQQALDQLMDRELPDADRERIKAVARSHTGVRNLHDLRTRAAGQTTFIQLHLEMRPDITLLRAHEISDEVEAAIQGLYPSAEIIIHEDPEGIGEARPPP